MPNNIVHLVVHKLNKDQHGAATIELANAPINVTPSAQRLIDHLHKLYADRPGKGYGKFEGDATTLLNMQRISIPFRI
jgi:nucleoid-associated protein